MATGYTSILKLALPVTGELAGTWGTVVNDNITQMIEQAIAGLATINTWTTNSHTLTVANGTSSESRCAMLVAADGAGLSAAGEIICPAASKLYVLKNGTSYQITLKTESGTGVAVPTGQTAFLFCDGTNVLSCGGVTSVTGTSPIASSGGATPAISLSANYGDTLNPYASKTANYVLAAPNGSAGVPTFRALVAADVPTLNQNTTGTAANVTGTVAIANGGSGQTSAQAAMNAFAGATTSGSYLRGNGTNVVMSAIQAGDIPTLNQNTTGTASNVTGTVAIANGGSGQTSAQAAMNAFAGATTSGSYLRGNGTNVVMSAIQAADVPTLNQNTTGTASNVTGTVAIANGGSGQTTAQAAMNAFAGAVTSGSYLRGNGSNVVMSAIQAGDVPTLNQNTTGTAANVTGTVAIANGGSGQTTAQAAMNAFAGAVTSGSYLRGNGTNVVMSAIQAADVPTLNQNTTGTAANVTGIVAIANGGTGQTTANAAFNALAPSQTGNSGKYLTTNGTSTSWATAGGGTPAGSNTQVQYNNAGAFGASSAFTWNSGTLKINSSGLEISARGGNNLAVGESALSDTFLSGYFNTAVGSSALSANTTAQYNTAIGYTAGSSLTSGQRSTFVGSYAGVSALTTSDNTAVGYNAYLYGQASSNVAIGSRALESAAPPTYGTGSGNIAIGHHAGQVVTTAANNVLIGYDSGVALTTGNNNTFVGYQTASTFLSGNNNIVIGSTAAPTTTSVSNEITLGNSSIATLRCQVTSITALSDARDKKDVQNIPLGVDFIQRLRPVSFVWNTRDGAKVNVPEFGFIAQELQSAQRDHGVTLPGLVHDINPDRLEAAPGTLIPVLVKAVQELQAQIDDLKRQLATRG